MSKSYIDKILLKPKKYNPYSRMKPAVKDSNFYFTNCISFNMVENLTQFKNKEISSTKLNLRLLNNLSFLFAKRNILIKNYNLKEKIKEKKEKNINNQKPKNTNNKEMLINNFRILEGYECFIPTKRIPYFNRRPINEKIIIKKESQKNIRKTKEIKIPNNVRNINFFRPCGRFYSIHAMTNLNSNYRRKRSSLRKSSDRFSDCLSNSIEYTATNTNNDDGNDENVSDGEYSLICGEINDDIFHEKEFINLLKTSITFPKYTELTDLIDSPFDDFFSPEMKYKKYISIFNEFMKEEENEDNNLNNSLNSNTNNNSNNNLNNNLNNIDNNNNNNCSSNITFFSNQENSVINISDDTTDGNNENNEKNQKIFIINPSSNNSNLNNLDKKIPRKSSKSGKLIKVNQNIFPNYNPLFINKTSISDNGEDDDDEGYNKDKSIFDFFERDEDNIKDPSKKIDSRIRKILPKSASKYVNKMNNQYIFLMHEKFKIISLKLKEAKSFLNDEIMLKKLSIQLLKKFLLYIGITSKKFFELLLRFEIHSKEKLNFEQFMKMFEIILVEKNKENLRFKFQLLLGIIAQNEDPEQILDEKQMNDFFDLIGCEQIYINNFCEILGERLVLRYKAIYSNENLDKNLIDKKFIFRKMKIILESFLDSLDS